MLGLGLGALKLLGIFRREYFQASIPNNKKLDDHAWLLSKGKYAKHAVLAA
jgi:hypothetical protein